MRQFLEHPAFSVGVSLLLTAIAASGRLSVVLSRILLFATFVVVLVVVNTHTGLFFASLYVRTAILSLAAFFLIFVGWWSRPPRRPENAGRLVPLRTVLAVASGVVPPRLEIGDSGAIFVSGRADMPLFKLMPFLRDSHLTVETDGKQMLVSTDIRDEQGRLVAELRRNEWQIAPPPTTWDRNYTRDALEVRDAGGRVVLQVQAFQDRIRLQGEWRDGNGWTLCLVRGQDGGLAVVMAPGDYKVSPSIRPMFMYPSSAHFGELVENARR